MRSSDDKKAREEETIGEPVDGDHASRKGRLTPRQMWARQARRRARGGAVQADAAPSEEDIQAVVGFGADAGAEDAAVLSEEPQEGEEFPYDEPLLEEAEEDSDEGAPAEEESEEKPEPVMVDPSMQPGAMNYPYATHRPAPDAGEEEKAPAGLDKRVSGGFIIGIVIIVFALILAISVVGQRSRISVLEERVRALEEADPPSFAKVVVGGPLR